MPSKINLDEKLIITEYLNGKSSLVLCKEFNVSKPTILKILKENNVTRKRDRCKSLDIKKFGEKYIIDRSCPKCGGVINVTSNHPTITCRNYFNSVNKNSLCKKCSLDQQVGEGNSFYGKKHTKETKKQISKSRKGKAMGKNNSMSNPNHRKKTTEAIRKKWANGEMEHVRKIFSEKLKETRKLGKIKSVIRSKIEKDIIKEIKYMGYKVDHSLRVETKIYDIYIPKLNLVIEFNGDYWHCNPKKYEPDYYHQVKKKTAKELWEYDKNKIDLVIEKGYNLEVVWESDYKSDKTIINKLIKKYDRK
jgi:G:T-mismatch repair DNA endonuclease (very short patch repair protein)